MNTTQSTKKGPGCFLWGCLALCAIGLAGVGCVGLVSYYAISSARSITSDRPSELPSVTLDPEKVAALDQRLTAYAEAIKEDQPTELVLTAADLNHLIVEDSDFENRIFIEITGDEITAQASLPMDEIPFFSGRYLNARLSLNLELENETLLVDVTDVVIEGVDIPTELKQSILAEMQDVNLSEELDPTERNQLLTVVNEIEVKDSTLILRRTK
jgi:hypothetical protein